MMAALSGNLSPKHDHPVQAWKIAREFTHDLALVRIALTKDISLRRLNPLLRRNPRLLQSIQTRGQDADRHLDTDLVPSLTDKEIRLSQREEPHDVKI